MATPKKNKNGTWTILIYIGKDETGKNKYKRFTGETKKEVEIKAEAFQKETQGHGIKSANMTVGEAVQQYIDSKEAKLSPKTIREYRGYSRNALQGLIDVKLYSLTDEIIQTEIDKAAQTYSPKSVCLRWGLFNTAIKKYRKGYMPTVELPSVKRKPIKIPTQEEFVKIFKEIEGKK